MMKSNYTNIAIFILLTCIAGCDKKNSDGSNSTKAATLCVPDGDDPISIRPQIVRVQKIENRNGIKYIYVGNGNGSFSLVCDQEQESCITPISGMDYFLFNKDTRWKFSKAKEFATLKFFQDWSITYNNQENVALVPVFRNQSNQWETKGDWGIFWLESWNAKQ